MTNVRVKPISELEVKSEVSVNDKILILDSVSEEARLASKSELKWDKWDKGDTWSTWPQGVPWTPWTPWKDWKDWEDWKDGSDWNWITSVTSSKVWKTTTVTMNFDEWDPFSFEVQDWQDGGGGGWSWDVVWPNSSTDWHLAVFDGTTGKKIKDWWALPTIPTKVSDLTNDSWYITWINSSDVTTALWYTPYNSTNPNGYITSSALPTKVSDLTNDAWYLTSSTWVSSFNWSTWAVTYTAPVSSVNGSTWAVTVSEFSPSGTATTGYVVTKTASWYGWAAPSGWDVMVSSQTGNILTSWMKIWAGTQADYETLLSYDSNTLYLVIE